MTENETMKYTLFKLLLTLLFLLNPAYLHAEDADAVKGKIAFQNKNMKIAKQHYNSALQRNPDSVEAKLGLAKIYRRNSRYFEREEVLVQQVLDVEPSNLIALRLQGEIYVRKEKWAKAKNVYNKILSSSPNDYATHVGLLTVLRELGDTDGMDDISDKLIKMHQSALRK
jgi:tetratricopeptide (TPR) repeat protein